MVSKIIRLRSGFYAVMVWDRSRRAWSVWWSGSKKFLDAVRECERLHAGM